MENSHCTEIEGTGLGLSIVKHGVAFLGGNVELISKEGTGTEITVTLPKSINNDEYQAINLPDLRRTVPAG